MDGLEIPLLARPNGLRPPRLDRAQRRTSTASFRVSDREKETQSKRKFTEKFLGRLLGCLLSVNPLEVPPSSPMMRSDETEFGDPGVQLPVPQERAEFRCFKGSNGSEPVLKMIKGVNQTRTYPDGTSIFTDELGWVS